MRIYELYIRFMIWLGATPPPGFEYLFKNQTANVNPDIESTYGHIYRPILRIISWGILGAIIALFLSVVGVIAWFYIEFFIGVFTNTLKSWPGITYVNWHIFWQELPLIFFILLMPLGYGIFFGLLLGIIMVPVGGIIGCIAAVQSIFYGNKSVTKPYSLLAYALIGIVIPVLFWYGGIKQPNRDDCEGVVAYFGDALVENNVSKVKRVTAPEQWQRIETWLANEEDFECPFEFDPNLHASQTYITSSEIGEGRRKAEYRFFCGSNAATLEVEGIILQKTEGWQVTNWGQIKVDK